MIGVDVTESMLVDSGYPLAALEALFGPPDLPPSEVGERRWSQVSIQEVELKLAMFAAPAYAQMVNSNEDQDAALGELRQGSVSLGGLTAQQIRDLAG